MRFRGGCGARGGGSKCLAVKFLSWLAWAALIAFAASPPGVAAVESNPSGNAPAVVRIGSQLELFVDDNLLGRLTGEATRRLHHPEPKEIALIHNEPWEGSGSNYHTVFKDGEVFRMYYHGSQLDVTKNKIYVHEHPIFECYAESADGIHWKKPNLGQVEFHGSKANNILFNPGNYRTQGNMDGDGGTWAVFKDGNPAAPSEARYKGLVMSSRPRGLLAIKSGDGLHWTAMSDQPVITDGSFNSQNIAFWDSARGEYRAYWRINGESVRAVRTAVSTDFIHWTNQADLQYPGSPREEIYTSKVFPYVRAPQILIGFPTRYLDRGWSDSMRALPDPENRQWRANANPRSTRDGTALTDSLFMASRDGVQFKRWNDAFLRPGIERPGTWSYGQQYIAWGLIETKSDLEGAPGEFSLFATENYWIGKGAKLRRYTIRQDGFVSVSAGAAGGELVTKPLVFDGKSLVVNFSSSAAGGIQAELQDFAGKAIPGYTLADCEPIFGDSIERTVTWKHGGDVSSLSGQIVRLRFALKDADLFSLRFLP